MMYGCDEVERQGTLRMDCNSTLVLFGCIIEFNNRVTIDLIIIASLFFHFQLQQLLGALVLGCTAAVGR